MLKPLTEIVERRERITSLRDHRPVVLPSLLLCDFGNLATEIGRLESARVHGLHLDVMDGHFVPNFTYGFTIVEAARRATRLPLDVHLMIANPERHIDQFYEAGADSLTIHVEATTCARATLEHIRELGMAAGIAFNPDTPVSAVVDLLPLCDLALPMSVQPGFGGQSFNSVALQKLVDLRQIAADSRLLLQVDGGVNSATIGGCAQAGAELFVVGSAIFGSSDYGATVGQLAATATQFASWRTQ